MKKTVVYIVVILAAVLTAYALRASILLAFLLLLISATFAFLVMPLCKRLERRMSGTAAALIAILTLAAAVVGIVLLIVPSVVVQAGEVIGRIPDIMDAMQRWLDDAMDYFSAAGVPDALLDGALERINMLLPALLSGLEKMLSGAGGFISTLGQYLVTPVMAFYLLRDRRQFIDFFLRLMPSKARGTLMRIGAAAQRELGRYVRGQLIITATTGLTTAIGLWIAGMPTFLIMGLIMSVFNLIPFVGPFIGAAPILVFAAADSLHMVFKALVVVLISQQAESTFVTPRIMSGVASVHPVMVILLMLCAGAAFGLMGLIFSIPAFMVLRCVLHILIEERAAKSLKSGI